MKLILTYFATCKKHGWTGRHAGSQRAGGEQEGGLVEGWIGASGSPYCSGRAAGHRAGYKLIKKN